MVLVREKHFKKLETPWMDGKWADEYHGGGFCSHAYIPTTNVFCYPQYSLLEIVINVGNVFNEYLLCIKVKEMFPQNRYTKIR